MVSNKNNTLCCVVIVSEENCSTINMFKKNKLGKHKRADTNNSHVYDLNLLQCSDYSTCNNSGGLLTITAMLMYG